MKPYRYCLNRPNFSLVGILCFVAMGAALGAQNSVVVWGSGAVTNVPADVTNVASVATASDYCIAVLRDGRLLKWGFGSTNVPTSATNVAALSVGGSGLVALRRDGVVVDQAGVFRASNAVAVAAADAYGAGAIKSDGSFVVWSGLYSPATSNVVAVAKDFYARLRVLQTDGAISPPHPGAASPSSNVVAMSDGGYLICLMSDGTVTAFSGLTTLPAGLSNVVAVAAGVAHGMALKGYGEVVAWGDNTYGQTNVPAGLSNAVAIAAGDRHGLALEPNGTVVAWGDNSYGQAKVPPGLTNVAAIFAGPNYSVAIVGASPPTLLTQPPDETIWNGRPATFTVKAIGTTPLRFQWQFNGEIIKGATNSFLRIDRSTPANAGAYNLVISNPKGTVVSRDAFLVVRDGPPLLTGPVPASQAVWEGSNATFTITVDGSSPFSRQWFFNGAPIQGANQSTLILTNTVLGQSGDYWAMVSNTFGVRTSTVATLTVREQRPVFSLNPTNQAAWWGTWVQLSAFAIGKSPIGYQWYFEGNPIAGENQTTLTLDNLTMAQDGNYWCVASNGFGMNTSTVARLSILLTSGNITAWGDGQWGQNTVPSNVSKASAIAAGWEFSMALLPDGNVVAWGNNFMGQTNVPAGLSNVTAIAAGARHALALKVDGKVVAWGDLWRGQTAVPTWLSNTVGIAAGTIHSLALRGDGTIVAWGDSTYGQTNVPVGLSNAVAVAAGDSHSLALRRDGTVLAWGSDHNGETEVPAGLSNVVGIACGNSVSLAVLANGNIVAWGRSTVPSGLSNVVALSTTSDYGLALHSDGNVSAWRAGARTSVPPGLSNVVAVAVGFNHYLVLLDSGLVAPLFECRIAQHGGNVLGIEVPTVRGKSYYLQYQDSLNSPRWMMRPPVPGDGNKQALIDPNASVLQRFYRVWQKP